MNSSRIGIFSAPRRVKRGRATLSTTLITPTPRTISTTPLIGWPVMKNEIDSGNHTNALPTIGITEAMPVIGPSTQARGTPIAT